MTTEPLTTDSLVAFQDQLVERATASLRDGESVPGIFFVITTGAALTPEARAVLNRLDAGEIPDAGMNPHDTVLVAFPLVGHPKALVQQAAFIPGRLGAGVRSLLDQAQALGVRDPWEPIWNGLVGQLKISEKDVQQEFMGAMVKLLNALAYVRLDDAYCRVAAVADQTAVEALQNYKGSLADDPKAEECVLVTLECAAFTRLVSLPYVRSERDGMTIVRIDPPTVLDTREKGQQASGRFLNILRPMPGAEPLAN